MLNELTPKEGERVALNAYRHAWSIVANIFVYTVTWLIIDSNQTKKDTQMNAYVFQVRIYNKTECVCLSFLLKEGIMFSEEKSWIKYWRYDEFFSF